MFSFLKKCAKKQTFFTVGDGIDKKPLKMMLKNIKELK